MIYVGQTVTVVAEDGQFRLVIEGQAVTAVPRTTTRKIHRYKAYATQMPRLTHPEGGDHMPDIRLDASDAVELAEVLQFLPVAGPRP